MKNYKFDSLQYRIDSLSRDIERISYKLSKVEYYLKRNDFYKALAWCQVPYGDIICDSDWLEVHRVL